MIEEYSST